MWELNASPTTCTPKPLSFDGMPISCCSPEASTTQSHPHSASVSPASRSTRSLDATAAGRTEEVGLVGPAAAPTSTISGQGSIVTQASKSAPPVGERVGGGAGVLDLDLDALGLERPADLLELGDAHDREGLARVAVATASPSSSAMRDRTRSAPPTMASAATTASSLAMRGGIRCARGGRPESGTSSAVRVVSCSSVGSVDLHDPAGLAGHARLEQVAGGAAVAEGPVAGLGVEPAPHGRGGALVAVVAALLAEVVEDRHQLVGRVVGERDRLREARPQARVRVDERRHLLGVAGGDHHDRVAPVLDQLHDRVDRLLPEVGSVPPPRASAYASSMSSTPPVGPVEVSAHPDRGLADEAGDQLRPVGLDQVALLDDAERPVDLRQQAGHGRLAGARGCR